jgi:hypothetical protein
MGVKEVVVVLRGLVAGGGRGRMSETISVSSTEKDGRDIGYGGREGGKKEV